MLHRPLIALALLTFCAPLSLADTELTPGLYQTSVLVEGTMGALQIPARTEQRTDCITAEDIAEGPPVSLPDNVPGECELVNNEFGDGRLNMEMVCRMQGGEGSMVGTGSYDEDSFEMTMRMSMKMQGNDMEMVTQSTGTRVGDC